MLRAVGSRLVSLIVAFSNLLCLFTLGDFFVLVIVVVGSSLLAGHPPLIVLEALALCGIL